MTSSRAQVLSLFRCLQRTRKKVFDRDDGALNAAREKIKQEFLKHKNEKDPQRIQELIQYGHEVEHILRHSVIQAKKTSNGNFRIRITTDTHLDSFNPVQR